ncbi:hypothetical protein AB1Y20_007144 [Prymnesium parvum]|uniref:SGNH hydrolase-type esterase domain-containing protein n=1 Tax=Prymnesium parvum TaxID=97485 RepID=A0AB34IUC9_PRYPA
MEERLLAEIRALLPQQVDLSSFGLDDRSSTDLSRLWAASSSLFSSSASPFRVRCLGGSVTSGSGSASRAPPGLAPLPFPDVLHEEIRRLAPRRRTDVQAYGVSGVGSRYHAACLRPLVPPQTELVVLDVSLNDFGAYSSRARTYAGLLHTLLYGLRVGAVLTLNWRDLPARSTIGEDNARLAAALARNLSSAAVLSVWRELDEARVSLEGRRPLWAEDNRHPSWRGHQLIGKLIALLLLQAISTAPPPRQSGGDSSDAALFFSPLNSTCVVGAPLAALGEGWRWVDESKDGRHRWGFVAHHTPGANLSLHAGRASQLTGIAGLRPTANVWLELCYLQSYGDWGEFLVGCHHSSPRCECQPAWPWGCSPNLSPAALKDCRRGLEFPRVQSRIDRNFSVWSSTTFILRGGPSCLADLTVRVTALTAAKVKVTGLKIHPFDPFF